MFIHNWEKVLKKAWSVKFNVLSIILGCLEFALPYFDEMTGYSIPRGTFLGASIFTMVLSNIARILAQKEFKDE
jgi:hypothetical protein